METQTNPIHDATLASAFVLPRIKVVKIVWKILMLLQMSREEGIRYNVAWGLASEFRIYVSDMEKKNQIDPGTLNINSEVWTNSVPHALQWNEREQAGKIQRRTTPFIAMQMESMEGVLSEGQLCQPAVSPSLSYQAL